MPGKDTEEFKFPNPFDTQYHEPWEQQPPQNPDEQQNYEPQNDEQQQPYEEQTYNNQQTYDDQQTSNNQQNSEPQEYNEQQENNDSPSQENLSDRSKMWKKLIVCCDGTGQSASNGISAVPTNVTRLARAIDTSLQIGKTDSEGASEIPQVVLYQTGVGTEEMSPVGSALSSAFGYGVDRHILEAYTFFALNYEEGDQLYLFGFSRGAFTARAIASLICNVGLLTKDRLDKLPTVYARYKKRIDAVKDRDEEKARQELETWVRKRVKRDDGTVEINDPKVKDTEKFTINKGVVILAMGLFDTVGSLGIPGGTVSTVLKPLSVFGINNKKYEYHDTSFPIATSPDDFRAHINAVYQVLALDECRASFSPTLLYDHGTKSTVGEGTRFHQIWMPGVHTDVGGGYERAFRDLSDISFAWMYDLLKYRLDFRPGVAKELLQSSLDPARFDPDADQPTTPPPKDVGWACSPEHDEYHTAKFKFGGQLYRSPGEYYLAQGFDKKTVFRTGEWIHPSVRVRMIKTGWKPPALDGFTLVRSEDTSECDYYWIKECKVPGKGTVVLQLKEWRVQPKEQTEKEINDPMVDMQAFLLDEDAKRILTDPKRSEKLVKVVGEKSGWTKWLTAF